MGMCEVLRNCKPRQYILWMQSCRDILMNWSQRVVSARCLVWSPWSHSLRWKINDGFWWAAGSSSFYPGYWIIMIVEASRLSWSRWRYDHQGEAAKCCISRRSTVCKLPHHGYCKQQTLWAPTWEHGPGLTRPGGHCDQPDLDTSSSSADHRTSHHDTHTQISTKKHKKSQLLSLCRY